MEKIMIGDRVGWMPEGSSELGRLAHIGFVMKIYDVGQTTLYRISDKMEPVPEAEIRKLAWPIHKTSCIDIDFCGKFIDGDTFRCLNCQEERVSAYQRAIARSACESPGSLVQPAPKPAYSAPAVWDLVITDMKQRDHSGRAKYGRPLQPNNGRSALIDAYQECLDLAVYLRQEIEERRVEVEAKVAG